jgi:hypothetical protein
MARRPGDTKTIPIPAFERERQFPVMGKATVAAGMQHYFDVKGMADLRSILKSAFDPAVRVRSTHASVHGPAVQANG